MAADPDSRFITTPWTMILEANQSHTSGPAQGLVRLCEAYHYPVYAFIRKQGGSADEARDLSQQFFLRLIEKKLYRRADPDHGRFRNFLLRSVKNYLINAKRDANRLKRGGGTHLVELDDDLEDHYARQNDPEQLSPENLFDREWAFALFDRVWAELRSEYEALGYSERFDLLKEHILGGADGATYADVAEQLGTDASAIKSTAFRMRKRFRVLIRIAVAQVVEDPNAVDEEIGYLIQVMSLALKS